MISWFWFKLLDLVWFTSQNPEEVFDKCLDEVLDESQQTRPWWYQNMIHYLDHGKICPWCSLVFGLTEEVHCILKFSIGTTLVKVSAWFCEVQIFFTLASRWAIIFLMEVHICAHVLSPLMTYKIDTLDHGLCHIELIQSITW